MKRPGAIIFIILPLIMVAMTALSIFSKPVHNVKELAKWADCEPENVRDWLAHDYEYDTKFNEVVGDNELTGNECITRHKGNCRCYATISQDTLNECPGYSAHMACMKHDETCAHALTFFTDPKGRKGFINSGAQAETFPASTPWHDVEMHVQGTWITP
jgi:hypothetical protein